MTRIDKPFLHNIIHLQTPKMSFSVRTKDLPVLSGLVCTYPECGALFFDLEECDIHAKTVHLGAMAALSCAVQEVHTDSGHVKLTRVYDESG
jgi:hypothetical protein